MKRLLFILFLSTFSGYLFAKHPKKNQYELYFQKILQHEYIQTPEHKFKIKELAAYRKNIWKSWEQANLQDEGPGFPLLDSLRAKVIGRWELPKELEPNATLPFIWGYKGKQPSTGYPLFIYIHGSGPKEYEWDTSYQLAQIFDDAPCIYFIPQIPNEGPWYRWWQKSKQFAWERLFRKAMLLSNINPNRLYIFGISEGGYGSQRLASFYADYFAAAGPMAGGEPLKNAPTENLSNTAFSLLTGEKDLGFYRNILTQYTQQSLDSLQALHPKKYEHRVDLIPDRVHHIDYRPMTPWLSQHTRNPHPKHFIWEDFDMDGLHRNGFYNLSIQQRPSDSLRTRYDVDIENNVIHIQVQNISYKTVEIDSIYGIEMKFNREYTPAKQGKFTLFLDEHLIDLERPVQVIVNHKEVYNQPVTLDVKNLLKSTVAFYDSERMYPAAIEINL